MQREFSQAQGCSFADTCGQPNLDILLQKGVAEMLTLCREMSFTAAVPGGPLFLSSSLCVLQCACDYSAGVRQQK